MPAQFALNPQILKSVPLFALFSDAQLAQLLTCVQHRSYPRNSFILRAGEETDALYIVLSGRVKVLIPDEEGHEVILSIMGPHEFFGEMGLLDDQVRSASVETLESCEMLRVSKAGFTNILKDNFDLAMLIMRSLVKRLREADRKIESLALIDVYGRVARLLIDMAKQIDGKWVVEHAPAKQEIARMIGASREMVSRVVKVEPRTDELRHRVKAATTDGPGCLPNHLIFHGYSRRFARVYEHLFTVRGAGLVV
jgi:CRP/FNR family transcriptional regulator, cyclic AMP receptor protein